MSVKPSKNDIVIFCDGACSGNPGPGGWGSIIASPHFVKELGGGEAQTTNNRMELLALIESFLFLQKKGVNDSAYVYSDSVYVLKGITQWIWGWKKRGWKTGEGSEVSNQDLWQRLDTLVTAYGPKKIQWGHVRGHKGIPGNERCDEIAVSYSQGTTAYLYDGSRNQYTVPIEDLPEDTSIPDWKSSKASKGPATYLSYVRGDLKVHKTWSECEARVKGVSGAKFKKVTSSEEQAEVLAAWGLDPATLAKDN